MSEPMWAAFQWASTLTFGFLMGTWLWGHTTLVGLITLVFWVTTGSCIIHNWRRR